MTTRYLIFTTLIFTASPLLAQEATFEGLGDLPGTDFHSVAYAVSSNGSVVVGVGDPTGSSNEAFRWTEAGGMEGLGFLSGSSSYSQAYGVVDDGSVVVGLSISGSGNEAFRWQGGAMAGLGDLPGGEFFSWAKAVSADGSVVAGWSKSGVAPNDTEAFRWEGGVMEGLGDLFGGQFFSAANDVSSDGTIVIGTSESDDGREAFRWTDVGGMEGLGDIPGGGFDCRANAVSLDGTIIVGRGESENGTEAFRWTESGGFESLGDLPFGGFFSEAFAVSATGSVVVGTSDGGAAGGNEAFIWMEETGMRNLKEVLEDDYGLDLTGWTLQEARDISDDGSVIVGFGIDDHGDTQAWRVEAPFTVADEATPAQLADGLTAPSPNPVRGTVTFAVAVEQGQNVTVEVFDVLGRRVRTLYDAPLAAGISETLSLDASALPAGVYVIRARGEGFTKSRQFTVVR